MRVCEVMRCARVKCTGVVWSKCCCIDWTCLVVMGCVCSSVIGRNEEDLL